MTARPSLLLTLLATRYLAKRAAKYSASSLDWPAAEQERAKAGEALTLELAAPGSPLSFIHDGFKFHLNDDRQLVVESATRTLRVGDYRGLTPRHGAWEAST